MNNIEFKSLKIRNFMSIDSMDVDFTTYSGITFISGLNLDDDSENGVGKTTMGAALWYSLTGEAPPKVKLAQIPNRRSGSKDFSVECQFNVNNQNYTIIRSNKKLTFLIGTDDRTKTSPSTNEDILRELRVDKLTLYQTLFVSVDGDLSFFDKGSADKIKYIESVLNLKIFEKLFDDTKKTFNALKSKKEQLEVSLEYIQRDITRNETEKDSFMRKKDERIAVHEKEITLNTTKLDLLVVPEFKRLDDYAGSKKKLDDRVKSVDQRMAIIQSELKREEKEMNALAMMINCPTCKKPFDDIHTKQEKIDEHQRKIKEKTVEKTSLEEQTIQLKGHMTKALAYEAKLQEESRILNNRANLETTIETIRKNIEQVRIEENPFGKIVESKQSELDEKKKEFEQLKTDFHDYEVLKFVYSPEGVKNHIVKRIINLFNDILKNYLIQLHSPFRLTFDEYFEETIIHDGYEIPYGTMSRGEKARIMLAIVFTFRELRRLQTGLVVDTTFYDEIFDIGLCKHGMVQCLEILEKQQKSFVITHRSENIDTSKYSKISLIKKNGLTSMVLG